MDHIPNRPMDVRSIVGKENVNSSTHAQNSLASGVAVSAVVLGSPAIAGFYVNVENNAGFAGGDGLDMDFVGSTTDFHVGIEGGDKASWYMQAGPALISPDGGDADVEFSGKIGGSVACLCRREAEHLRRNQLHYCG